MGNQDFKHVALSLVSNHKFQAGVGAVLAVSFAWYIIAPGFFLGFVFGCFTLLTAEVAGLAYLWILIKPKPKVPHKDKVIVGKVGDEFNSQNLQEALQAIPAPGDFLEAPELAGVMWLCTRPCEREDDSPLGHGKLRKNVKGFSPHGRCAKLDGLKLVLTSQTGSSETILLEGCEVKAFSETETFKKKWTRKFPVRISHPLRELWMQSREVFIYFPDGWQKELWTGVLRKTIQSAGAGSEESWQSKIRPEFFSYRKKVQIMYPDLLSLISAAAMEPKADGMDGKGTSGASRLRWRRRPKALAGNRALGDRSGDDWENSSLSSVMKTSSGAQDRSAVAPPLGLDIDAGFRGKVRNFMSSKRAMLQEFAKGTSVDAGPEGSATNASKVSELMDRVHDLDAAVLPDDSQEAAEPRGVRKGSPRSEEKLSSEQGNGTEGDPLAEDSLSVGAIPQRQSGGLPRSTTASLSEAGAPGHKHGTQEFDLARSQSLSTEQPQMESAVCAVNFLIARLFFDLEYQKTINMRMQARLDEKLGLILTPAAIGQLSCSKFEFGSSPPLLKSIRPSIAAAGVPDGFYSMDVEIVYQGKATFTIETRLDLKDSPFLMGDGEGGNVLEEESLFASFGEGRSSSVPRRQSSEEAPGLSQPRLSVSSEIAAEDQATSGEETDQDHAAGTNGQTEENPVSEISGVERGMEQKTQEGMDGDAPAAQRARNQAFAALKEAKFPSTGSTSSTSSASSSGPAGSRKQGRLTKGFKDILTNMASGLSQVPLSITVTVTAVKGTLRVRVPPPPNDRLWVGFIEKPDLSLSFTPSIGEKQLKRFPLATKIVDKVKELVNRTMVLPSCVDIPLSFMKADPDDWLPREPRMLPWRPAVVPRYGRGISDAVPGSASEAISDSTKNVGDSEIGWEEEPRLDSIALGGFFNSSKRSVKPDASAPMASPALIPSASWRAAPRLQSSPSRRSPFAPRDPAAPNRSILAAAKTSLQTAASFVKTQPQGCPATPSQGQVFDAGLPPSSSTLVAEVRKAATGLFKGRREQNESQLTPANVSKSLPPGPTVIEQAGPEGPEEAVKSRSKSEDWTLDNDKIVPISFTEPHEPALERISENSEWGVRRSSSARQLDGIDTLSAWKSTPLAAHISGETGEGDKDLGFVQPMVGPSSEWHGTEAVKGDMSGFGASVSAEHSANSSGEMPLEVQASDDPEQSREWHVVDSMALVQRTELTVAIVEKKEIISMQPAEERASERPSSSTPPRQGMAEEAEPVGMGSVGEEDGRRGVFLMRKDLSDSLRNRAKDLAGKLGDKEMHAQAKQMVGQVMGETKEKAKEKVKKFASFLKERQATLSMATRHSPDADL